ncbi:MAG: phospho-N-acetylmuramoyl-pentapeptide-transferase, partial [Actinomycetes bacterium]
MRSVLIAAGFGLIISILLTPLAIRAFRRQGLGQEIRDDGPESHLAKQGTPTMGGTVIVGATLGGYLAAHVFLAGQPDWGFTATGLLLIFLMVGMGTVGFLDDYLKIRYRRSLGLNKTAKLVGQLVVGVAFAVLALNFPNQDQVTPASTVVSYVRDIEPLALGSVAFVILAYLFIAGFSNAVNLTDGLDGLAAGSSAMVFASYVFISFWQFTHDCANELIEGCYTVRDPLDVTLVAAAGLGACLGFLWWNTSPARIFMGDTGSLALGGLLGTVAVAVKHEIVLAIVGGLFVLETLSVIIQVASYKMTGKRVFRMAPLH